MPTGVYTLPAIVAFTLIAYSLFLPSFTRYRTAYLIGLALFLMFICLGAMAVSHADPRQKKDWAGHFYKERGSLLLRLKEPLQERTRSYRTTAELLGIHDGNSLRLTRDQVIVYFRKDSALQQPRAGSIIIANAALQNTPKASNPAGFDYGKYLLTNGITHQVYLTAGSWLTLNTQQDWLQRFLLDARQYLVNLLRTYIKGEKEKGLAEALLIGYKEDLDKTLVQSYTNTGVVHIIAISGLHLGLIYWLLLLFTRPLMRWRRGKWLRFVLIVAGLWLFSLLAGAQPSILRSAVMFTCIITGQTISRASSIYNTLAVSAFLLLCYNPFWILDVGFQLSYTAVLSLLLFAGPIYQVLSFRNRLIDMIWKMNSVTIAAQLLTTPLCLYHFHQFPNYFLLSNFVAVPLSSAILFGEIVLCMLAFLPPIATLAGIMLTWMIKAMNGFIEWIETLPFSVWTGFQISAVQAVLLTASIVCIIYAFINRTTSLVKYALACLLLFTSLRMLSFVDAMHQQKIIVYHVPGHTAIDFIQGRTYASRSDTALTADLAAINFHLQPARTLYRLVAGPIESLHQSGAAARFGTKRIVFTETLPFHFIMNDSLSTDLLIVSGNTRAQPATLLRSLPARKVVLDGSLPAWKARRWQSVCDSLQIDCYNTSEKGAFVMNIR